MVTHLTWRWYDLFDPEAQSELGNSELSLFSKSVKGLREHTLIFACALKLSICTKGAQCYLRTKSVLTYLGWG